MALVDTLGQLARFKLLPGHRHESLATEDLLDDLSFDALLADRGFDGGGLRGSLAEREAEAVTPPKSNCAKDIDCDTGKYRKRHLVENFFCKIKYFRCIATRYDQTASSYAALIWVACAVLTLE